MSVPPNYGDLGKNAKNLFSKGFNYGTFKIESKTKTSSGIKFTSGGNQNHDSGKFAGSLETEFKWNDYGLTFTEKWNTDNMLGSEITIEDQLVKGLKLSFDTQFAPQTGKKSGKIKTGYKQDHFNAACDVDFDFAGPTIHGSAVAGYNGWLAGYQASFDTSKSKLAKSNFAVGYALDDFTLHTSVNDGTEFAGSVFQRVNDSLETGVHLNWTAGSNATKYGMAAKYAVDEDTTFRAKLNNASQLGLAYQQKLRDGITMSTSILIEGKNFNQGGHKLGLGFDFEA